MEDMTNLKTVVLYALKKESNYVSEDDFSEIKGVSSNDVFLALKDGEQRGYFIVASGMGSDKKIWYLSPDGKLFARTLVDNN
jgi:hypothetical protein